MPASVRKDSLTGETAKRKASLSAAGKSSRTPSQRASIGRTSKPAVSAVCRAINFNQTLKENNSKLLLNSRSPAVTSSQNARPNRPLSQVNHQSSNNAAVNILRQHRANLLRNNVRNSLQSANQRRLDREHRNSLDKEHLIKHDEESPSKLTSLLNSAKLSNENEKTPNGKTNGHLAGLNNSTNKLASDSRRTSLTSRLSVNRPSNEPTNKPTGGKQSNSKTPIKQPPYPNVASPSLIKPPTAQLIHHSPAHQNQNVFNYSNLNIPKFYDDDLHCTSESHELRSTAAQRQADHRLYAEQNLSASCNRLSQAASKNSNTSNLPSVAAVASCSTPSLVASLAGQASPVIPLTVMRNYEVGELIGEGNFAVVHQCTHKRSRRKYALKVIDKRKCAGKEAMIENEVAILRKIKHSNIVSLHEDYDYPNELYLVMELVYVSCFERIIFLSKTFLVSLSKNHSDKM